MKDSKAGEIAVVLGGGGITGIAWESGIIAGLLHEGIRLADADVIIGTSAGSFVGAALSSGYDMNKYYISQQQDNSAEPQITASAEIQQLWVSAFRSAGDSRENIGKNLGEISLKYAPEGVSGQERLAVLRSRLVTDKFPATLKVTSIDAASGKLHLFSSQSGISLEQAVAASGAVPGVWPALSFDGTDWIDGGMISSTNVLLAKDFKKIIVIAPLPHPHGIIPGVVGDIEELKKNNVDVFLFAPNQKSQQEIGENIYDVSRTKACANAGFEQGVNAAKLVKEFWMDIKI